MGRRKRMIDTSLPEAEEEVGPSRTKKRAKRKDHAARLEALATTLARLPNERRARLALEGDLADAVQMLSTIKKGSGMARQRRRVAGLLRELDDDALDDLESRAARV